MSLNVPVLSVFVTLLASCSAPGTTLVKDEFSGTEFFYYDAQDRQDVIHSLQRALNERYAPLPAKNLMAVHQKC